MTAGEYVRILAGRLKKAEIQSYRLDAELLVSHVLGIPPMRLLIDNRHVIPEDQIKTLEALTVRREKREPLAYITGTKEFYSLDFSVNPDVLIPRPESEFVVEAAVRHAPRNGRVLDICTGSGAIAVAFKHERPDCTVSAADISERALATAEENARRILGPDAMVSFYVSDLFARLDDNYDIITANPPYIPIKERQFLQAEVLYEPELALFAEADGLAVIRRILEEAPLYLTESGMIIMEIHSAKHSEMQSLADEYRYNIEFNNDYARMPRVALLKRK